VRGTSRPALVWSARRAPVDHSIGSDLLPAIVQRLTDKAST